MEVNLSSIGGLQETEALIGIKTYHSSMRCTGARLDVATMPTHEILELPSHRVKGLVGREKTVLVLFARFRISTDDQQLTGHRHFDPDSEVSSFPMAVVVAGPFNDNTAAGDARIEALQLQSLFPDQRVQRFGGGAMVITDSKRDLHVNGLTHAASNARAAVPTTPVWGRSREQPVAS